MTSWKWVMRSFLWWRGTPRYLTGRVLRLNLELLLKDSRTLLLNKTLLFSRLTSRLEAFENLWRMQSMLQRVDVVALAKRSTSYTKKKKIVNGLIFAFKTLYWVVGIGIIQKRGQSFHGYNKKEGWEGVSLLESTRCFKTFGRLAIHHGGER